MLSSSLSASRRLRFMVVFLAAFLLWLSLLFPLLIVLPGHLTPESGPKWPRCRYQPVATGSNTTVTPPCQMHLDKPGSTTTTVTTTVMSSTTTTMGKINHYRHLSHHICAISTVLSFGITLFLVPPIVSPGTSTIIPKQQRRS